MSDRGGGGTTSYSLVQCDAPKELTCETFTISLERSAPTVSAGGTASGSIINSGGHENVRNGGTDLGATINNGGLLQVSSGGKATNPVVLSGGMLTALQGGTVDPATI